MLSIRLSRVGKKKQPNYRVIVLPKERDPWGKYLENLGSYNPRSKEVQLKTDRIKHWLSVGAQPSDTVYNLLVANGVIEGIKRKVSNLGKKFKAKLKDEEEKKKKKEEEKKTKEKEATEKKEESKSEEVKEEKKEEDPAEEKKA